MGKPLYQILAKFFSTNISHHVLCMLQFSLNAHVQCNLRHISWQHPLLWINKARSMVGSKLVSGMEFHFNPFNFTSTMH